MQRREEEKGSLRLLERLEELDDHAYLESSFLLLDLLGVVVPGNVDVPHFSVASKEVLDFIRPKDDVGGRFIKETRMLLSSSQA